MSHGEHGRVAGAGPQGTPVPWTRDEQAATIKRAPPGFREDAPTPSSLPLLVMFGDEFSAYL